MFGTSCCLPTLNLSHRQASQPLIEAGLPGVMRLDEVRRVEIIPVLGTGKTDYRALCSQIVEELTQPPGE